MPRSVLSIGCRQGPEAPSEPSQEPAVASRTIAARPSPSEFKKAGQPRHPARCLTRLLPEAPEARSTRGRSPRPEHLAFSPRRKPRTPPAPHVQSGSAPAPGAATVPVRATRTRSARATGNPRAWTPHALERDAAHASGPHASLSARHARTAPGSHAHARAGAAASVSHSRALTTVPVRVATRRKVQARLGDERLDLQLPQARVLAVSRDERVVRPCFDDARLVHVPTRGARVATPT